MFEYPLVEFRWVSTIRRGVPDEASLRETLVEAHEIDDLDWSNPLEASAVLGMLLALVRDAVELTSIDDFAALWQAGRLPADVVDTYLAANTERFDLFHPVTPFMQVADLEAVSRGPKPVALIVPEVATGNNVPLFSSGTESSLQPLSPAAAARRLIACHAWDTAAIKTGAKGDPQVKSGKTTGNPPGPLGQLGVVTLLGRTLFETLLLNLPLTHPSQQDRPAWRAHPPHTASWQGRQALGVMDLYTWQSRRIRLFPAELDSEVVVLQVLVAAGDRLPFTPEFEHRTAWRRPKDSKPGEPQVRPRRLQPGRAAWRGLAALVTGGDTGGESHPLAGVIQQVGMLTEGVLPDDYPLNVQLVGVAYGNQSAVIEHVISDRTPLPLMALDPQRGAQVRACLDQMSVQADAVASALNQLQDNLRLAVGGEKLPWDKGQRMGEVFLGAVSPDAHRVLAGLSREPEKADVARLAWERMLRRRAWSLAEPLIAEAPARAFLGHGDGGHWMRQQSAEAIFRRALNEALPATRPTAHAMTTNTTTEAAS